MTGRDPIDLLELLGSSALEPDDTFRDDLFESLSQLLDTETLGQAEDVRLGPSNVAVVDFAAADRNEATLGVRRVVYPMLAAAAAIVLVVVLARSGEDRIISTPTTADVADDPSLDEANKEQNNLTTTELEESLPNDPRDMPPLPELAVRSSDVELATARELLAVIGDDGLTIATIEESNAWDSVSFDPVDPDRVLFGDWNLKQAMEPELWRVGPNGTVSQQRIPWVDEQVATRGGIFQPDGLILMDPGMFGAITPVLDNDGKLLMHSTAPEFLVRIPVGYNGTVGGLLTPGDRCPYLGIGKGFGETVEILDGVENGFARAEIVEPGILAAFPSQRESENCGPTSSQVARVWNIETGESLPDHPLDGLTITRAVVSGNGGRALTIDDLGVVSVIDMATNDKVADLGSADSFRVGNTMALNHNGTLAVVSDDSGPVRLWHVDSETVLVELAGDARTGPSVQGAVAAGVAFDGSRVAVLDAEAGAWRIVTFDPNDWLEKACAEAAPTRYRNDHGIRPRPGPLLSDRGSSSFTRVLNSHSIQPIKEKTMMQRIGRLTAACAVAVVSLLVTTVPISADGNTTQFDGVATAVDACAGLTEVFGLDMVGDELVGCLINTSFTVDKFAPSGTYSEYGTETFIGCVYDEGVEVGCGSFDTTYRFTAKYDPVTGAQKFGRCQHPIIPGTGTGVFAGATGRIDFKDDVDAGLFYFRGHVSLADGSS